MLRSDRSLMEATVREALGAPSRNVLLALAPRPAYAFLEARLWPRWLAPVYRAGSVRPSIALGYARRRKGT